MYRASHKWTKTVVAAITEKLLLRPQTNTMCAKQPTETAAATTSQNSNPSIPLMCDKTRKTDGTTQKSPLTQKQHQNCRKQNRQGPKSYLDLFLLCWIYFHKIESYIVVRRTLTVSLLNVMYIVGKAGFNNIIIVTFNMVFYLGFFHEYKN